MKKLQEEIITAQMQKQEHQDQMEPLQEQVVEVLLHEEEAKTQIAQTHAKCAGLITNEVVVQVVDTIKEKTVQAQTQATQLKEKFQTITKEIEEAQKDQVSQDEPHVSVGGLLAACQSGKKYDHGDIKRAQSEAIAGGEHNTHTCKKACTRRETTGRRRNTHT